MRYFCLLPALFAALVVFLQNPVASAQQVKSQPAAQAPLPGAPAASSAEVDVPPPESVQADVSEIEFEAIVRVEVDTKTPNFRVPWNIGGMGSGVGTGFMVGKNQFLTNAHVVSNNRLIYIKKVDDPKPYKARVLHIAHDCDLALLEIEDKGEFQTAFGDVEPLYIGWAAEVEHDGDRGGFIRSVASGSR